MPITNTVINGTDLVLLMGGAMVAHAKSHSISISRDTREVSSKSSGDNKEIALGRMSWNAKVDGMVSYATSICNYNAMFDAMLAKTAVVLVSQVKGTSDILPLATSTVYTGSAYITSLEQTSGDNDNVTFSVSFEGTGALVKTTAA